MSTYREFSLPSISSILHPTDFSESSRVAFYHALKMALVSRSQLHLLHVSDVGDCDWSDFPGVRETLEKWGILAPGSSPAAVPNLGIDVRKAITHSGNPVKAVMHFLEEHFTDLIVLATHQHEGRAHWLQHSVAEPVARNSKQMTLFIPGHTKGFVNGESGEVHLKNILVPIASVPSPQPAIEAVARLVKGLNISSGVFTLLHVGDSESAPDVDLPEVNGWSWNVVTLKGDVIEVILDQTKLTQTDLVVMSTDGRDGFLDALRGSNSERVLHHVSAPLLTIPIGSHAESYVD